MKKIQLFVSSLVISSGLWAQQIPTNNSPVGASSGYGSREYWSRAGNSNINGNNNIFGTLWNSPIYTQTNGVNRMKLNGNVTYNINGSNAARNGYLLIGGDMPLWAGGPNELYSNVGAFSLLHLNGGSGTFAQPNGHRSWMKTGVTFTDNNDMSYIGLRQIGTGNDITETTITWTDNSGGGAYGPDDMVFRFTTDINNNTISTNLNTEGDADGRHIARFTGTGEFGLGNTFGINATGTPANLYVRPASLGHYSLSNMRSVWQQFTNRNSVLNSGTGETANDGLRIGIVGHTNTTINGVAAMYNQENNHLLFSTNAFTNNINVANGNTGERVRITAAGTPTLLQNGSYGIFNPGGVGTNITRVAISHNPSQPVTRPMSLLHLGYNTGIGAQTGNGEDGYRGWMDIGTFTSNGTDHIYVGLKNEGNQDKYDAVIGWGDNQINSSITGVANGPDNLRFIFTSTTAPGGLGTGPAILPNGLEGMRMTPTMTSGVFTGIGGDPGSNTYFGGSINPTATLEVNSWGATNVSGGSSGLRFTNLNTTTPTIANPGTGVLAVNANGDVIYVDLTPPPAPGSLGNVCGATTNPLAGDYEIPLNNQDFYFPGQGPFSNSLTVGLNCGTQPRGKLHVLQTAENFVTSMNGNFASVAGYFENTFSLDDSYGVYTKSVNSFTRNIGIYAEVSGTGWDFAGMFEGDIYTNGIATAINHVNISDIKFKKEITRIDNPLEIISRLNPSTYFFKKDEFAEMNFNNKRQYGFIAQEVESILPELVIDVIKPGKTDSTGIIYPDLEHKAVNYDGFIAILVGAVQEQQHQIDSLTRLVQQQQQEWLNFKQEWEEWKNNMGGSTAARPSATPTETIELNDMVVLNQNVPNPFAEQTTISYIIPDYIQEAQIIFYDMNGKSLKTHVIKTRGEGRLTIFADDLSSGVYSYTLIVDGRIHDTKKMIKN